MKYIICSDIHGNKDRLSAIIRHSKVGSPGSRLVHLGDICDIGPYTEECMDILEHYNAIELIGNHECFSEDTEILTDIGWKFQDEITEETRLATLNYSTNKIEWQRPLKIIRRNHNGEMYFLSSRNLDLLITPNHRLLYANATANKDTRKIWRVEEAKSIEHKKRLLLRVSGSEANSDYTISDNEIRIAAWFITDGYIQDGKYVSFSQRESKHHLITNILDELGWSYSIYKRQRNITAICGKTLIKQPENEVIIRLKNDAHLCIRDLVPERHILPEWLWKLSDRQFDIFLHTFIDGDGSRKPGSAEFSGMLYPHDKKLVDSLQELCFLHNYRTTFYLYNDKYYRINITKHSTLEVKDFSSIIQKVNYNGLVWCATVPNDTLVVRRNGKIVVTGNCAHVMGHQIQPYDKTLDHGPFVNRIRQKVLSGKMNFVMKLDGFVLSHAGISQVLYQEQLDIFTVFSPETLNKFMVELFTSGEKYHKLFYDEDFSPLWYRPGSFYKGKSNDLADFPQIFGHTPRSYYSHEWINIGETNHKHYMTDGWNEDGSMLYAVLQNSKVKVVKFWPD